jgi:GST-like protein
MIDLYYWTTPNGHKITMFLEETGSNTASCRSTSARANSSPPTSSGSRPTTASRPSSTRRRPTAVRRSLFESGAILLYLADKTGRFIPADLRGRTETIQWLFWQMGGLGPMAGQNHHFTQYAPEKVPYAIERYTKETARLYAVLNKRLADREFFAGDYSIADMACYPWIVPHSRQGQNLDDFPHLKRWFAAIRERPATKRAYALVEKINPAPVITEAEKKILFGQDASTVRPN